jgi:acetyltransferase-like isoleucine patch superfamily enzyme
VIGARLFDAAARLDRAWHRMRTRLIYGPFLKRLGRGSVIRRPILVSNPGCIEIGERVLIREGARLEVIALPGQPTPRLRIGAGTNIEQNVHIVCHHRVVIGPNVSVTANCAIVDTTHPFEGLAPGQKIGAGIAADAAFVEIGEGAFLGIGTVVLPNVTIGPGAVIGANSVVTQSLPAHCCAAGAPARVLRTYQPPAGRADLPGD